MRPKNFWDHAALVLSVLLLLSAGAFPIVWITGPGSALTAGFLCGALLLPGLILLPPARKRCTAKLWWILLAAGVGACALAILFLTVMVGAALLTV